MTTLENQIIVPAKYGLTTSSQIVFIRVDSGNLSPAIKEILDLLCEFSWLNSFDKEFLRKSMEENAQKTCDALRKKFYDPNGSPVIKEAGEYIVSMFSKKSIVDNLQHKDIPLAELLGRQVTGNPGFDFFTEDCVHKWITCGEAKYRHQQNAYGSSLEQINRFIRDRKHISDISILNGLASDESLDNISKNSFGVCAAFSCTNIPTDRLLTNIVSNKDFLDALNKQYKYIILVAVNIS